MATPWLQWIELSATSAMVGVIWVVQLLTYPAFRHIPEATWVSYHRHHTRMISLIVVPFMLAELVSGLLLLLELEAVTLYRVLSTVALSVIWVSTFAIQVPLHHRLSQGRKIEAIEQLIRSNWIRTVAWTAKLYLIGCDLTVNQ